MGCNSGAYNEVIQAALALARHLHPKVLDDLSDRIAEFDTGDWQTSRSRILSVIPYAAGRDLLDDFLEEWREYRDTLSPESIAFGLRALSLTGMGHEDSQTTEIVWTGPHASETSFRRTRQVLLQLIHSARERLTVVCFAVYKVDSIREALIQAANRGVQIRIILESADASGGKTTFDMIEGLGEEISRACTVLVWPADMREKDPEGKHGSLHAKAVIADNHTLYVSSANLTEFALDLNIELGVVISGGELPKRVDEHFSFLIRDGTLVPVRNA